MTLWNKYQQKIINNCNNPLDHEGNLSYWRNFLFANTLAYIIPLFILLVIPSSIFCYVNEYYVLIFINFKTILITILVAFLPSINVSKRKLIFSIFAFLHSFLLILYLGDFGGGLIFLLSIGIFCITIFPNKYAFVPVLVSFVFGVVYTIVIIYNLIPIHDSIKGEVLEWIVLSLSTTVLITIFAFLLPRLFANMQTTIENQKKLQIKLNNKNVELLESEEKLRLLNTELECRVEQRTKDLEEANVQLGTFTYSISHDLQSPIRAINVYTSALNKEFKDLLPDEGKGLLNNILSSTTRMTSLIQSLLKFSKINKQGINKKLIDLNVITKAVWLSQIHQDLNQFELKLKQLPKFYGESVLIQQVMENLISNAIKYSSKEEKPIIEIGAKDNVIYVKDNGVGFNLENHKRIFGLFKRLHTNEEFEGNGVGLSLVKLIIEKHGGKVWAESEEGKGATFFFTLPN